MTAMMIRLAPRVRNIVQRGDGHREELWNSRLLSEAQDYGLVTTSFGADGSRKRTPTSWFALIVAGMLRVESSMFFVQ